MTPAELDAMRRRATADTARSDPTAVGMARDVLALLGELDVQRETGRLARNHVRQLIAAATGGNEGELDPYAPPWVPASMWAELKTLVVEHRVEIGRLADRVGVAQAEVARYRIEVEAGWAQIRDLADLLDAARTERDKALLEAAEWKDQLALRVSEVKALHTRLGEVIQERDAAPVGYDAQTARRAELGLAHDAISFERDRLNADLVEANEQRDLLRRRVEVVTRERDQALRAIDEWVAADDRHDAEIKRLRRSRRKMRNRYEKILADDQAVVTGLRAGMTVLRGRLKDADGSVRTLADEAQAEADLQAQRIAKLRRSQTKWRRRANRALAKWIEATDGAIGRESVIEAAVGWYRIMPAMPDQDIFSRSELALHAAVAAWLQTPAVPTEPAGETPAGPDAQERTPEAAERISAALSANSATFHEWLAAGAVCGYGNSGTPVDTDHVPRTNQQLRARSCPTCHSIGDPRDGCADPWHAPAPYVLSGDQFLGERPAPAGAVADDEPLPHREPGAAMQRDILDADTGKWLVTTWSSNAPAKLVSPYPVIADRNDADTYLAGLLNAEAATPVPLDRADPDGAADDDWATPFTTNVGGSGRTYNETAPTLQVARSAEWRHRDDNATSTLIASIYPYGANHPDFGVQLTIERDRLGANDPDRTWQCLRLPDPNAVALARWILSHYYAEWDDTSPVIDRVALNDIGTILDRIGAEGESPADRLTSYINDRQAQLDDWVAYSQRIRTELGIGPHEDTLATIRELRAAQTPEPIRDVHAVLDAAGIPPDASAADRVRALIAVHNHEGI